MWQSWLTAAVMTAAAEKTLNRNALANTKDAEKYIFGFNLGATCILLLLLPLAEIHLTWHNGSLLLLSGFLWFSAALLNFKADERLEVSHSTLIAQLEMVFIFSFGIWIFREELTFLKMIGVAFIVFGLAFGARARSSDKRGAFLKILATLFLSSALLLDKYLSDLLPAALIALVGFCLPFLFSLVYRSSEKAVYIAECKGLNLCAGALAALTYYFLLQSFRSGPVSLIYPLFQVHVVLAFILGILVLKERENLKKKTIMMTAVVIGAVFLQIEGL